MSNADFADTHQTEPPYFVVEMIVLVLDIETTGLSKTNNVITVIGTIVYESLDETDISDKCHNMMVAEESQNRNDIVIMKKNITKLLDDAECVVAFNSVRFNMPFIMKWLNASSSSPAQTDHAGKRKTPEISSDNLIPTSSKIETAINADPWKHKYLDFCLLSREHTGSYISLRNACLWNNISVAKSGSGLQAVHWAKEKNWERLESYCMQDVVVLLALTKHAVSNGLSLPIMSYGQRGKKRNSLLLCFDAKDMKPTVHKTPLSSSAARDIFETASPRALNLRRFRLSAIFPTVHDGPV